MGERVAIITDIHGNSEALKAVLDDIERENISHIYCLGDMVAIGHETNKVMELLFSQENISFVLGNHEESILKIVNGVINDSDDIVQQHHEWIANNLDPKYIESLAMIPKRLEREIAGKKLLFVHYHLFENNRFLPLDTEPTEQKLEKIYENTDIDIVCFGHHHTIHHFKTANRLYVNPGSLGCGHSPLAPYGIIEIGREGQINVQFKEVPYDNTGFLREIERLKFPAYEFVLKNFHGNQHLHL
ncbi:metallophosphoesterase family protein [Ornithinibacillus halotolerans]|uniref:Phosphodiesterase n=1 Tax=Ornithinibacillus halotolerans TaxID=1274357 RepID=A0A916S5G3_9BACI|nr:metallophosphoesterase family protein [Ornithinibacillus halotolerans]GGA81480.1 phosphodiesterase [Ornithinibacillus halotolerans]